MKTDIQIIRDLIVRLRENSKKSDDFDFEEEILALERIAAFMEPKLWGGSLEQFRTPTNGEIELPPGFHGAGGADY